VPGPDQAITAASGYARRRASPVVGVAFAVVAFFVASPDHTVATASLLAVVGAIGVVAVVGAVITRLASGPHEPVATSRLQASSGARRVVPIAIAVVTFLVSLHDLVTANHLEAGAVATRTARCAILVAAARRPALGVAAHLVRATLCGARTGRARRMALLTISGAADDEQADADKKADPSEHATHHTTIARVTAPLPT
jgi:hypothetical protein